MPQRTLFRSQDADEIDARIERLKPDTPARWGKMNVAQMLSHCQAPLRVATGEKKLGHSLIGKLFGRMAKKKLMQPGGFEKNMPTHADFKRSTPHEFEREQAELRRLVRAFAKGGPKVLTPDPHPFFGPMTQNEWETLMWKHLDHHLRQFGV
jgi:hypothetical protein